MIKTCGCNKVIVAGDMNSDKKRNNGRVSRLTDFLSENKLVSGWDGFDIDYTHEFEKDSIPYTSTRDYFAWNNELGMNVSAAGVLHLISNTSDHLPIYCDLAMKSKSANDDSQPSNTANRGTINTKALNEND